MFDLYGYFCDKLLEMSKLSQSVLVLFFVSFTLFACQQAVEEASAEVMEEKLAQVEMKVDGMVCAMGCAKFIEDKVAAHDGVTESSVDFENGVAYFTYNENAVSAEDLEKFIDEIHDGQYDATISKKTELKESEEASSEEVEEESVVQVVNQFQNISFPELLTYFMKRL